MIITNTFMCAINKELLLIDDHNIVVIVLHQKNLTGNIFVNIAQQFSKYDPLTFCLNI